MPGIVIGEIRLKQLHRSTTLIRPTDRSLLNHQSTGPRQRHRFLFTRATKRGASATPHGRDHVTINLQPTSCWLNPTSVRREPLCAHATTCQDATTSPTQPAQLQNDTTFDARRTDTSQRSVVVVGGGGMVVVHLVGLQCCSGELPSFPSSPRPSDTVDGCYTDQLNCMAIFCSTFREPVLISELKVRMACMYCKYNDQYPVLIMSVF